MATIDGVYSPQYQNFRYLDSLGIQGRTCRIKTILKSKRHLNETLILRGINTLQCKINIKMSCTTNIFFLRSLSCLAKEKL